MLTRRNFTISLAAFAGTYAAAKTPVPTAKPADHSGMMRNVDCNDAYVL